MSKVRELDPIIERFHRQLNLCVMSYELGVETNNEYDKRVSLEDWESIWKELAFYRGKLAELDAMEKRLEEAVEIFSYFNAVFGVSCGCAIDEEMIEHARAWLAKEKGLE